MRDPKKKAMTKQDHHTTLIRIIERGIMAPSPSKCSHNTNTGRIPPAPQNNPIIVSLFQAYFVPPHSRTSRNRTAKDAKRANPGRSRFESMVLIDVFFVLSIRSGILIARRSAAAKAPMGRLILKPE
jgi:hypothetical protein